MAQDENKAGQYAMQKLLETLGEEALHEKEGPGVYYLTVKGYGEFYIVEQASPIISDAAKSYGKRCPDYADLLFYSLAEECGGSKIIDYELEKYAIDNNIPSHNSATLHNAAAYGAEAHPEYFGAYPAPVHTPWGYMLRYRCIGNGIFWLETDQRQEVLTICYPIWSASLSDAAVKLGVTLDCDQKHGIHICLAYLFFRKPDACIPIFELMRTHREWEQTGRIAVPALMNAIWQNHPGYVLVNNAREQLGANDVVCWLLGQLGIEEIPNISEENMIVPFPGAGVEYICW